MGKYLEAKSEIDSLKNEQKEQRNLLVDKIDDIKRQIEKAEKSIDWRQNATSLLGGTNRNIFHIISAIFDFIGFFICLSVIFLNDVKFSSFGELFRKIFLIEVFSIWEYACAIAALLALLFLFGFINSIINIIFNSQVVYRVLIRKPHHIIANIINIIICSVAFMKYNEGIWESKYNGLSNAFNFALNAQNQSRLLMLVILIMLSLYVFLLLINTFCLIFGILKDLKIKNSSAKYVDEKLELEGELEKVDKELKELSIKQEDDIKIAEQLANAILLQGNEYYKKATESEPYDRDLIAKAVEYDNPHACYYYCKSVLQAANEDESMSRLERKKFYVDLRPYFDIARKGGIPTAEYLYIESIFSDSSIDISRKDLEQFLETLLNAKKNPNFDRYFAKDCASLIDAVNETIEEIVAEEAKEAMRRAEEAKKAKEAEESKEDIDKWTVSFVKSNPNFCKNIVKNETIFIRHLIENGDYSTSIAGFDRVFKALYLFDEAKIADVIPYFRVLSYAEGLIFMVKLDNRESSQRRKIARDCFETVSHIGAGELTQRSKILIKAIDSGISFTEFKRKYSPDFPYDVLEFLDNTIKYMW